MEEYRRQIQLLVYTIKISKMQFSPDMEAK